MPAPSPPPYSAAILETAPDPVSGRSRPTGKANGTWVSWFSEILAALTLAARSIGAVRKTGQSAAIASSVVAVGTAAAGLYRVSVSARISVAAGVSSQLTVTLRFTDGGINQAIGSGNIVGNTTTTIYTQVFLIHTDPASPILYETTYNSVGVPPMQYEVSVVVEEVPVP